MNVTRCVAASVEADVNNEIARKRYVVAIDYGSDRIGAGLVAYASARGIATASNTVVATIDVGASPIAFGIFILPRSRSPPARLG